MHKDGCKDRERDREREGERETHLLLSGSTESIRHALHRVRRGGTVLLPTIRSLHLPWRPWGHATLHMLLGSWWTRHASAHIAARGTHGAGWGSHARWAGIHPTWGTRSRRPTTHGAAHSRRGRACLCLHGDGPCAACHAVELCLGL